MRRSAVLAILVAAAIVASLAATIPGAFARSSQGSGASVGTALASGQTVTGVIGGQCTVQAGNTCMVDASIYPSAKGGIPLENIGIIGGSVEHPECAGDVDDPIAAPGVLCIYPVDSEISNVFRNSEGAWQAQASPVYTGQFGFKVAWTARASGPSEFQGIWAYQAP